MGRKPANAVMPLRAFLGRRVREIREQHDGRQDDLAAAARQLGLTWSRSVIGALERGDKALSAEELILLPEILNAALGLSASEDHITVPDLFTGTTEIALTPSATAPGQSIGYALRGSIGADGHPGYYWSGPMLHGAVTEGEAEQRAAAKLGRPRDVLTEVYAALWGRSLSAERDLRALAAATSEATPGNRAARRGRITRELISEVELHLAKKETRRGKR